MPKKRPSISLVKGRVLSHNVSPKGHVEGILVESDDGVVQVNYPKHAAANLARRLPVGSAVELSVDFEDDGGDHLVYVARDMPAQVTGSVVRFNYALHGEVNGYHLDDGTFVHVKPDGARRYKVKLGDRIVAAGDCREGEDAVVMEAERVSKVTKPHAMQGRRSVAMS
jgi:hypothetical protein